MSKSELKKLILEQQKDDTYFIAPKITRRPRQVHIYEDMTLAEIRNLAELADLDHKETICITAIAGFRWPIRELGRATGFSHTTIRRYYESALKKIRSMRTQQQKSFHNINTKEQKSEPLSDSEIIQEMFRKYENHKREKPDRRHAPKYKIDYYDKKKFHKNRS